MSQLSLLRLTFAQGKLSGPSAGPISSLLHLLSVLCRKAKAIELMLVDALLAAEPVLKMTERIHDPREFLQMDDTILKQVEHYGMLHPDFESSDEYAPVAAAQQIISRYAQQQQQPYRKTCSVFLCKGIDTLIIHLAVCLRSQVMSLPPFPPSQTPIAGVKLMTWE